MILYPTETIYGLGVHAFDQRALGRLYELKGRDLEKSVSWLVRDIRDIERYALMSTRARRLAEAFLPGRLTLVLPVRRSEVSGATFNNGAVGFRISSDPCAEELIREFMAEHDAPLTCTSANISGMPTRATPSEICFQFGQKANMIERIIDDGQRTGTATTVIEVMGDTVTFLREGAIQRDGIMGVY